MRNHTMQKIDWHDHDDFEYIFMNVTLVIIFFLF
jgi:hypothetical protein